MSFDAIIAMADWNACKKCSHYSDKEGCTKQDDKAVSVWNGDFIICENFVQRREGEVNEPCPVCGSTRRIDNGDACGHCGEDLQRREEEGGEKTG